MFFQALIAASLPPEVPVTAGAALPYAIARTPVIAGEALITFGGKKVRVGGQKGGSYLVLVDGKTVRIPDRMKEGYDFIVKVVAGRDGSLLVTRRHKAGQKIRQDDFIRVGAKEMPVTEAGRPVIVKDYRDARNFVGTYFTSAATDSAIPMTLSVKDGVRKTLGYGHPIFRGPGDDILVQIPMKPGGMPSGRIGSLGEVLRLYRQGQSFDIGPFAFIGTAADGRYVFAQDTLIADWRDGKIVTARRIPENWQALQVSPSGDILIRERPVIGAEFNEDARDWNMAILRDAEMHPVKFDRPKGTETYFWRYGGGFEIDGRIRIEAFHLVKEEAYILRPRP